MNRPKELDATAARFWDRHARRLKAEGLLREATFDSFLLLCKTYSLLTTFDPTTEKNGMLRYVSLSKLYQTYARGFGMSTDKPRTSEATEEVDEFGL